MEEGYDPPHYMEQEIIALSYSRITTYGTGSTNTFNVQFTLGYIATSDVRCRVGTEADGLGAPVYRTCSFDTPGFITISGAAPGNLVPVVFERTVSKTVIPVDFSDGAEMDEANLDGLQTSLMMQIHEVLDGRFGVLANDLDMGTYKIKNLAEPVNPADAVTKAYTDAHNSSTESAAAIAAAVSAAVSAGTATVKAEAASVSETKAEQWAENPEDDDVETGKFSAKHWAAKAAASATVVVDGDRGDIVVSGSGTSWMLDLPTDAEARLGALSSKGMNASKTRIAIGAQTGSIDVNTYSDGTGSAANDQIAINAALAAARLDPRTKDLLFTRDFKLTNELALDTQGLSLVGSNDMVKIIPQGAMTSMFYVTKGLVQISRLHVPQASTSYATSCIRVNKAAAENDLAVKLSNLFITGVNYPVRWEDGTSPVIENLRSVNCVYALDFRNNGMNGHIHGLYVLGGGGLRIRKDGDAVAPSAYQMEGVEFSGINVIPGKVLGMPAVDIRAGLALSFHGMVIDQVYDSSALLISGTESVPASSITFNGLWAGASTSRSAGAVGINCTGAVSHIRFIGGEVNGFDTFGMSWGGSSASVRCEHMLCEGFRFFSNTGEDWRGAYADGTMLGNYFGNSTAGKGVYEIVDCKIDGFGNYFGVGPQQRLATSQWLSNRGAGASRGIPTATTGLVAGQLWIDTATSNVVKMV